MRIGIDASSIMSDRGGVGWHTYYLLRTMVERPEDIEFVAYVRPGTIAPEFREPWTESASLKWVKCARWRMRWRGSRDGLDLYHGPNFKMHTTGRFGGVVTIHDLWLDRHPEYSKRWLGQAGATRRTKRVARNARAVITVSHFSASEIVNLYGLPPDRVRVIPNGVSEAFVPVRDDSALRALRTRLEIGTRPYLLFVGGADPRKNHRALFEAIALRRTYFQRHAVVLVGSKTHRFGSFQETARRLKLEDRIVCPGRLPIEDIRLLYSYADLFVYPSLYEGFGLPILEAMACGAPVVTSKTTSMPEAAGDAAVLIDPQDPTELAEAMIRVLEDAPLRETLRKSGFEHAKEFSWSRTASLTISLYRELCR
jgi:glycosyltransferase involved in cell wall biosynthesis